LRITTLHRDINVWNSEIDKLPQPAEGENPDVTDERKEFTDLVGGSTKNINKLL